MDGSADLIVKAGLFNDLIVVVLDDCLVNWKKDTDCDVVPLTIECYGSTQAPQAGTNNYNIQRHLEFD